jgi:hypothetical protein
MCVAVKFLAAVGWLSTKGKAMIGIGGSDRKMRLIAMRGAITSGHASRCDGPNPSLQPACSNHRQGQVSVLFRLASGHSYPFVHAFARYCKAMRRARLPDSHPLRPRLERARRELPLAVGKQTNPLMPNGILGCRTIGVYWVHYLVTVSPAMSAGIPTETSPIGTI